MSFTRNQKGEWIGKDTHNPDLDAIKTGVWVWIESAGAGTPQKYYAIITKLTPRQMVVRWLGRSGEHVEEYYWRSGAPLSKSYWYVSRIATKNEITQYDVEQHRKEQAIEANKILEERLNADLEKVFPQNSAGIRVSCRDDEAVNAPWHLHIYGLSLAQVEGAIRAIGEAGK